jgi:hypothetical protein
MVRQAHYQLGAFERIDLQNALDEGCPRHAAFTAIRGIRFVKAGNLFSLQLLLLQASLFVGIASEIYLKMDMRHAKIRDLRAASSDFESDAPNS